MPRTTFASAAIFTPLGLLALTGLFTGAVATLLSAGATEEVAGLFALVFVMGTGESVLHVLDKAVHRALGASARRRSIANAQANARAPE
jgi:hypothetical protein